MRMRIMLAAASALVLSGCNTVENYPASAPEVTQVLPEEMASLDPATQFFSGAMIGAPLHFAIWKAVLWVLMLHLPMSSANCRAERHWTKKRRRPSAASWLIHKPQALWCCKMARCVSKNMG